MRDTHICRVAFPSWVPNRIYLLESAQRPNSLSSATSRCVPLPVQQSACSKRPLSTALQPGSNVETLTETKKYSKGFNGGEVVVQAVDDYRYE